MIGDMSSIYKKTVRERRGKLETVIPTAGLLKRQERESGHSVA